MLNWARENYKQQTYEKYKIELSTCGDLQLSESALSEVLVVSSGYFFRNNCVIIKSNYANQQEALWILPGCQLYMLDRFSSLAHEASYQLGTACKHLSSHEDGSLLARRVLHRLEMDFYALENKILNSFYRDSYLTMLSTAEASQIYQCCIDYKNSMYKTTFAFRSNQKIDTDPEIVHPIPPNSRSDLLSSIANWQNLIQELKLFAKAELYEDFKTNVIAFLKYTEPQAVSIFLVNKYVKPLLASDRSSGYQTGLDISKVAEKKFNADYTYTWLTSFYEEINV